MKDVKMNRDMFCQGVIWAAAEAISEGCERQAHSFLSAAGVSVEHLRAAAEYDVARIRAGLNMLDSPMGADADYHAIRLDIIDTNDAGVKGVQRHLFRHIDQAINYDKSVGVDLDSYDDVVINFIASDGSIECSLESTCISHGVLRKAIANWFLQLMHNNKSQTNNDLTRLSKIDL